MIKERGSIKFQERIFNIIVIVSWILIVVSTLGLSHTAPKFLESLHYYLRIYICIFLMWRFNPLRKKYEFTELDRKMVFTAGFFIFTTTVLNQYLKYVETSLETEVKTLSKMVINHKF